MERLDILVERIRKYTMTQSFTDAAALGSQIGLQTQTIVDLFNEAQHAAHGVIYSSAPELFVKTTTIDLVADTEAYDLPSDAFLGVNIISVEFKYGSGSGDYRKLKKRSLHERDSSRSGNPNSYIQRKNQILVNSIPSAALSAGLRVTYEYRLPELDVRRGKVSAVDDVNDPTSITITDKTQGDIALGAAAIPDYITVVDTEGNVQMDAIPVTSYSSTTGVITLNTFMSDASEVVAVNDYVVVGKRATTHSDLPEFCEKYLVNYVTYRIFDMQGHPSVQTAMLELQREENRLMEVFSEFNADITYISEIDPSRIIDL